MKHESDNHWGKRFKHLRIKYGKGFCQIAKEAGISKGTLSKFENKGTIKVATLEKILSPIGLEITVQIKD